MSLITDQDFAARKREIQQQMTEAERTYGAAALAAAVGKGKDGDQRLAKDAVDNFRDQLGALDAAWDAAIAERRAKDQEAKVAEFDGSCDEVERIAQQAVAAVEDLPRLIAQVRIMVDAYGCAYGAIQRECQKHKLDLTGHRPGHLTGSAVAKFNHTSRFNYDAVASAIGGLLKLQEKVSELPFEARSAIDSFRPKPVEREDA